MRNRRLLILSILFLLPAATSAARNCRDKDSYIGERKSVFGLDYRLSGANIGKSALDHWMDTALGRPSGYGLQYLGFSLLARLRNGMAFEFLGQTGGTKNGNPFFVEWRTGYSIVNTHRGDLTLYTCIGSLDYLIADVNVPRYIPDSAEAGRQLNLENSMFYLGLDLKYAIHTLYGKDDENRNCMRLGLDIEAGRFLGSTGDWQIGYAAGKHGDLVAHGIAGTPGFSRNFVSVGLDVGFEGRARIRSRY